MDLTTKSSSYETHWRANSTWYANLNFTFLVWHLLDFQQIFVYIQNLAKEIKNGELELYHEIKQALEASKADVDKLLLGLGLCEQDAVVDSEQLSSMRRDSVECEHPTLLGQKAFYDKLAVHLQHKKRERKRRFKSLKKQEHQLCYETLGDTSLHLHESLYFLHGCI